jgi:tetratricopeptide (TPR) repeat protein
MLSLVFALLAGAVVFGVATLAFDLTSGLVLGGVTAAVAYFLLVRRHRKKVEATFREVEAHIKGQRIEKAVGLLDSLRPVARWQPLLGPAIDAQIGMLRYAYLRDFEGARPHLEKAHGRVWQAWAMLGAYHFKKNQFDDMKRVFERAVKKNKKESSLWAVYGWCEWKRGKKDEAIAILARGTQINPKDERLKTQLLNLQNGKKLKMHSYGPDWIALHLEKPPGGAFQPPGGGRPRYMPPANKVGGRRRYVSG